MFTVEFQYNFRQMIARFSAGRRKVIVSDMLLFRCSWFKYRFIKLDLVTKGKFCFHFSPVCDSVVDCVNVSPSMPVELNHGLRDAQNICTLTKVGTVLKFLGIFITYDVQILVKKNFKQRLKKLRNAINL